VNNLLSPSASRALWTGDSIAAIKYEEQGSVAGARVSLDLREEVGDQQSDDDC